MKKILKKVTALLMVSIMTVSLVACGGGKKSSEGAEPTEGATGTESTEGATGAESTEGSTGETKEGKEATIGVAFYQDTGLAVDATKAYLESLSEKLNTTFKYTVLTQTDESANLTKIQELISSGVDGIICTMDLGTSAIIQECEAAGVYLGGYLSDYDTSYTTAHDEIFKNPNFVGTVADGPCTDEVTGGHVFLDSLVGYNERNPENPITHVAMDIFPIWAFPSQTMIAEQFVAAVEEYNATAETKITVDPLNEETDVLNFAPMDSSYFAKHAEAQAIMSFAAGTAFVYPTMVSAGVDKTLKLFTSGFDGGEENNFGTAGTGTYQQLIVSAPEAITYPLVLLLNKINGVEFKDQPTEAERVGSSQFVINSDEALSKFEKSLYFTGKAENALYTADEVLNMTAYANPEATYAELKGILAKMTIEDLK